MNEDYLRSAFPIYLSLGVDREVWGCPAAFINLAKKTRALSILRPFVRHTCESQEAFGNRIWRNIARLTEKWTPIVGGALVGLGLHLLFGNLDRDAAQLGHLLGIPSGDGLGVLPSIMLAASQIVKTIALDRYGFWLGLLRCWYRSGPCFP